MGTFEVAIRVGHMVEGDLEEVSTMVDTGATDTVLPASLLQRLLVQPDSTVESLLANGDTITSDAGQARIAYNGFTRVCPVIFGGEGVYLLGATTLEILRLAVGPVNQELLPAPPRRARPF
jgi:predicted aspartyl protease